MYLWTLRLRKRRGGIGDDWALVGIVLSLRRGSRCSTMLSKLPLTTLSSETESPRIQ